ncbi:hypothetical protein PPROV_000075700 [Pycnococcus provasolii]|uniref:Methyltransferase domain-containing protein n=1 Tax=Pycnococcus provasolii TaxID=41880 RepID=A0A830H8M4_9CHLO|nr:hypothetical protein PPROV_000075700 [Pycnococcus provasolii]
MPMKVVTSSSTRFTSSSSTHSRVFKGCPHVHVVHIGRHVPTISPITPSRKIMMQNKPVCMMMAMSSGGAVSLSPHDDGGHDDEYGLKRSSLYSISQAYGFTTRCRSTLTRAVSPSASASSEVPHSSSSDSSESSTSRTFSSEESSIYEYPNLYEAAFDYRDIPLECAFLINAAKHYGGNNEEPKTSIEFGCGPAAHSVQLSKQGLDAHAMDTCAAMRAHAKQRAQQTGVNLNVLEGDMASFDANELNLKEGSVDLAVCMLGTIAHLITNDACIAFFSRVEALLSPNGVLIIETNHPSSVFDGAAVGPEAQEAWDVETNAAELGYGKDDIDVDADKKLMLFIEYGQPGDMFDPVAQVLNRTVSLTLTNDDNTPPPLKRIEECVPMRQHTAQEIDLLARLSGLRVCAMHSNFELSAPESNPDPAEDYRLLTVLRRA